MRYFILGYKKISNKVGIENLLGRKEDVKAVLEALGIKEGQQPEKGAGSKEFVSPTPIKQQFILVPNVGEVTVQPLYMDDIVRKLSKNVIEPQNYENNKPIKQINWNEAMILASALNLELLSNNDYWQCIKFALKGSNKRFLYNLKTLTWTRTWIIWEKVCFGWKVLEGHGYEGGLPVIIENSISHNPAAPNIFKVEAGELVVPTRELTNKKGYFTYKDLEKKTGLPFRVSRNQRQNIHYTEQFFYHPRKIDVDYTPILCGCYSPYSTPSLFCKTGSDRELKLNISSGYGKGIAMFCKKPNSLKKPRRNKR